MTSSRRSCSSSSRTSRSRSPSWDGHRRQRPLVVLTSNRTRELHDALKRRWSTTGSTTRARARGGDRPHPRARGPIGRDRVFEAVSRLRTEELYKLPGVGETITWARALGALDEGGTSRRRWASR